MAELTWQPLTVREWLESVRSRGGVDGDWAHLLIRGLEDAPDDGDYFDNLLEEKL